MSKRIAILGCIFDLRLLRAGAQSRRLARPHANRSSPVWNGNTFSHYRHPADKYNRTADTDHHAGCGTRHLTNSSWDINAAERAAANDTGARNPGNHAANEHYDSEHAGVTAPCTTAPTPSTGQNGATATNNGSNPALPSSSPTPGADPLQVRLPVQPTRPQRIQRRLRLRLSREPRPQLPLDALPREWCLARQFR